MVLEKIWLFWFGNGAEIQPLEKGRKSPAWPFFYSSGVKFDGMKIWEPHHDHVICKSLFHNEVL